MVRTPDARCDLELVGPETAQHRMIEPQVIDMRAAAVFRRREVSVVGLTQVPLPCGQSFEKWHGGLGTAAGMPRLIARALQGKQRVDQGVPMIARGQARASASAPGR